MTSMNAGSGWYRQLGRPSGSLQPVRHAILFHHDPYAREILDARIVAPLIDAITLLGADGPPAARRRQSSQIARRAGRARSMG